MPMLWEHPEPLRHTHAYIVGPFGGLKVKNLSGTEGLDAWVVGLAPGIFVADVDDMFDVFLLIPLP